MCRFSRPVVCPNYSCVPLTDLSLSRTVRNPWNSCWNCSYQPFWQLWNKLLSCLFGTSANQNNLFILWAGGLTVSQLTDDLFIWALRCLCESMYSNSMYRDKLQVSFKTNKMPVRAPSLNGVPSSFTLISQDKAGHFSWTWPHRQTDSVHASTSNDWLQ